MNGPAALAAHSAGRTGPLSGSRPAAAARWDLGVTLLTLVFVLTIFEGAARKWLFAESPLLRYGAYFAKDLAFVAAAALGMRRQRRFSLTWAPLAAALMILPSAAASLANSTLVGAMLSIRAYLIIPVCAWLAAPLVRGFRDVERCAAMVAASTVIVGLLGAYQYKLPQGHFLNRYETGAQASQTEALAGRVRATGTFAYISGMTVAAGLGAWAGMVLTPALPGRSRFTRQLGAAAVAGSFVCALVCQSRSALLAWAVSALGGWILFRGAHRGAVLAGLIVVALAALGLANPVEQVERAAGRDSLAAGMLLRIRSSDTFVERLTQVGAELWYGVSNYPLGEGIGLGQPGGMYARYQQRIASGAEFEWGRISFEIGVAGLLAVLGVRLAAGLMCWRALQSAKHPAQRLTLAASLPFFAIMAIGNMGFNHTGNSAAWAVMTLAFGVIAGPHNNRRVASRGPQ